jgi:hypothetical protein
MEPEGKAINTDFYFKWRDIKENPWQI